MAGTDAPYPGVFQGEGIHHELELLVEAGLEPVQAIACATGNAARFMGGQGEWGTVSAGCQADLVVVDGDPTKHISQTRDVSMVVQAGKVLDRRSLRYDPATEPDFRPVHCIA